MAGPDDSAQAEQLEVTHASWEWIERAPTVDEVKLMLKGLPLVWGVGTEDFIDYVQPLPQSKNVSQTKGVKDYKTTYTLYVSVAGRIKMLEHAADMHDWEVDFEPEPMTPTGIPGYLDYGERIVYREYCVIRHCHARAGKATEGGEYLLREWRTLGRKPGTAWVPGEGGSGAVESNRFEKVETSARGRSIGAWGFGVLPGSGIASLEEMLSVTELRTAEREGGSRRGRQPKPDRSEVESELRQALARYEEVSGIEPFAMDEKVEAYVSKTFGKEISGDPKKGWDFGVLNDGEIIMFRNRIRGDVTRMQAEKGDL